MRQVFEGWNSVSERLRLRADDAHTERLNAGQKDSLRAIAKRLSDHGVLIADEVGMGKTRIAVELARCVVDAGGRVAILVPPGLGFQWESELQAGFGCSPPMLLRSLWQYLERWSTKQDLQPWFAQEVVLVSHAFTNWRLSESSQSWRWAMLPAVLAQWQRRVRGKFPRGYGTDQYAQISDRDSRIDRTSESIVEAIPYEEQHPGVMRLTDIDANVQTWQHLLDGTGYDKSGKRRAQLRGAVGLGLGLFDLIVIDEAHKSRAEGSGLSNLLNEVILESMEARRVALTATPLELHKEDWLGPLERIGVDRPTRECIGQQIKRFDVAVRRLRACWRTSEDARAEYMKASEMFSLALSPYVLRRSKLEDESIRKYHSYSGVTSADSYRLELPIYVEPQSLSENWKQVICASEALSRLVDRQEHDNAKYLRLTLGSGHGIGALIDSINAGPTADEGPVLLNQAFAGNDLRQRRIDWWQDTLRQSLAREGKSLYRYPSIQAAADVIDQYTSLGEKVLVFGRFTRPMRALVDLLNARAMFQYLEQGRPWPQAKVHEQGDEYSEDGERSAVQAAYRGPNKSVDFDALNSALSRQYEALSYRRDRFRESLISNLATGLNSGKYGERIQTLFTVFRNAVDKDEHSSEKGRRLSLIARAISDLLGLEFSAKEEVVTPTALAEAFAALINAATNRESSEETDQGKSDNSEYSEEAEDSKLDSAINQFKLVEEQLHNEYSTTRGRFARFMYGNTNHASRRLIQSAFNRPNSFPKVLVAQSMVGREGLNLHEACRIVVLLHPEWNPAVVEQQIGRVDRVGSHWARRCAEAIDQGVPTEALPRIEIRPVVFRQTYDEYNWKVLQERWDDLRAQLHGMPIPARERLESHQYSDIIHMLTQAAPNFSPSHAIGGIE